MQDNMYEFKNTINIPKMFNGSIVSRLGIPYTAKRYFLICQKEFQSEYDFICIYLLQYDTYCDSKCDVKVLSR